MSLSKDVESLKTEVTINSFYANECLSISGRSTLTYEVGKHVAQSDFFLRIARNTGGGVWCKDWIPFAEIEAIVLGAKELKAQSFQCLHPGRSINTGGFVLAALCDLGLVRSMEANTRLHEHVPMTTLELVVQNPQAKKTHKGGVTAKSHSKLKDAI